MKKKIYWQIYKIENLKKIIIKVNIENIYKRKGAEKRGSMSKDKVGLYKNSRVLLYEGQKRNYVRFLLTKKP